MPMTPTQRKNALEDLEKDLPRRFRNLSAHDLHFVREYAAEIATQHHDQNYHECIVIHVDLVPRRNDTYAASLEYGSSPRYTVIIKDDDDNLIRDLGEQHPEYADALVHALRYLRVPTRLKTTKLVDCTICGSFHPTDFDGDCRDDGNRFPTPNDPADEADYFDDGTPSADIVEGEEV